MNSSWCGGAPHEEAALFCQHVNNNDMNIQFTFSISSTTTNFLDLTLSGSCTSGVEVSPFRKDTATNLLLMATSCHPQHVVKNLPVGELIRAKRYSSR